MFRRRICCRCGVEVTANTWKNHIKSNSCSLSQLEKNDILNVLELKTEHTYAWLIRDGEEACGDRSWFLSVLNKDTTLSDWQFARPRKLGACRPSICKSYSISRVGQKNPSVTSKTFSFTREEVLDFTKKTFYECCDNEDMQFGDIHKIVNERYRDYKYLFANRLKNKEFLHIATGISIPELEGLFWKRRGVAISRGQRSSPKCIEMASKMASELLSTWRISKPHKILFAMCQHYDPNCSIEYKLMTPDNRTKSYDIYSPLINGVIEMHGRVWHDKNLSIGTTIENLVSRNIQNDLLKKKLAENFGLVYHVFWDDEIALWNKALNELYGKEIDIDYQKIKDTVSQESGS